MRSPGPEAAAGDDLEFNEVRTVTGTRGGLAARNLVGSYISSLEMRGFSVTVGRYRRAYPAAGRADRYACPAAGTPGPCSPHRKGGMPVVFT